MKIAFIGYGKMTRVLAKRWTGKHDIFIGGRDTGKAAELATEVGASQSGSVADAVRYGSIAESVGFGEIVVISTPAHAVEDAMTNGGGGNAFAGKIILDINNPVSAPGYPHATTTDELYWPDLFDGKSLAERIAALAPKAKVVKAFNMCAAPVWEMDPPVFDGRKLSALYCGDDEGAKKAVAGLIELIGCKPVDIGELKYARLLEAAAAIVIKTLFEGSDAKTVLTFADAK